MRYIIHLLLVLLIFGCKTDRETNVFDDQKAYVVGHVNNPSNDKVALTIEERQLVVPLKSNGNFRFEIELDHSVYALFNHNDELADLFLRPGDSLFIQIDDESENNLLGFAGIGKIENQFLKEKKALKSAFQLTNISVFNKPPKAFSEVVNKYQMAVDELLDKYIQTHLGIDPLFKKQQSFLTKYEMGSLLLDYPLFKGEGFDESKLPPNYFDFLSNIELNNAVIQNTIEYKGFIQSYISRKTKLFSVAKKINQIDHPLPWTQAKINVIESEVTLPNIRANLITESIEWHLYNHACQNIDSLILLFKSTDPDPEDALRINNFANRCQSLRPGKIAPSFSGIDENGDVVMSTNLVGKNIYVDVWATWCGPCKKETPHFEKLIQQYKDNDQLGFVSISFDKKKEVWDRYMKSHELNGLHLISPKAFESKMANDYGISNIPRYILIDKSGLLINADAPLPSSNEIKSILAKLAAS